MSSVTYLQGRSRTKVFPLQPYRTTDLHADAPTRGPAHRRLHGAPAGHRSSAAQHPRALVTRQWCSPAQRMAASDCNREGTTRVPGWWRGGRTRGCLGRAMFRHGPMPWDQERACRAVLAHVSAQEPTAAAWCPLPREPWMPAVVSCEWNLEPTPAAPGPSAGTRSPCA